MNPGDCITQRTSKGLTHWFDETSGWCVHGCGNRDDGRHTTIGGSPLAEPAYLPAQPFDIDQLERQDA